MSALREDALATLRAWTAPDARQQALRQEYVDHLDVHADGMTRGCHPDHVTAGALILSADHTEVLLTLHSKAKRWFHMGGHCEPEDSTLAGAALREATEESGVEGLVIDQEPVHLDAHVVEFCGSRGSVRHLDVRFLALAPHGAEHAVSDESLDVAWWPVDDLPTDDVDMQELVGLALRRAQSASSPTSSSSI